MKPKKDNCSSVLGEERAKSDTRYGSLFNFMAEPTQEQLASTLSKAAPNYY
jgi:hypothetical protein